MLAVALRAQARGFHIFPVTPMGKTPHRLAGSWGETATNDINQIIHFWTRLDPNANVGIACAPSQLLVVDLDMPKEPWKLRGTEWEYVHQAYGPYVSGLDLIDEMAYKLADENPFQAYNQTYTVRTGSGGVHLYYAWPAHWPKISQASPAKGVIDVRGNGGQWGGYVLAEGCVTDKGPYQEMNPTPPGLPPEWIRHLVAEKPVVKISRPQGLRQPGAISWSGLVDSVRHAGQGNRNNALHWAARAMCSDQAPEEEALKVLGPPAEEAGLQPFEIERTIQSAYRAQRRKEGL